MGPPVFWFVPHTSSPIPGHYWKESDFLFFEPSLQVFVYIDKTPRSLLQGEQALLSAFPHSRDALVCLSSLCPFSGHPLIGSFLSSIEKPGTTPHAQVCPHHCWAEEKDQLPWPVVTLLLRQLWILVAFLDTRAHFWLMFSFGLQRTLRKFSSMMLVLVHGIKGHTPDCN